MKPIERPYRALGHGAHLAMGQLGAPPRDDSERGQMITWGPWSEASNFHHPNQIHNGSNCPIHSARCQTHTTIEIYGAPMCGPLRWARAFFIWQKEEQGSRIPYEKDLFVSKVHKQGGIIIFSADRRLVRLFWSLLSRFKPLDIFRSLNMVTTSNLSHCLIIDREILMKNHWPLIYAFMDLCRPLYQDQNCRSSLEC